MERPSTLYKYERLSWQSVLNLKKQCFYFAPPHQFNDPYDCTLEAQLGPLVDADVARLKDHYLQRPELAHKARRHLENAAVEALRQQFIEGCADFLRREKAKFLSQRGIACFSEQHDSLLMWAHYGGSHGGFCLEFDTSFKPFDRMRRVRYSTEVPTLDPAELVLGNQTDQFFDIYCTKSQDWAYEREWRVIHMDAGTLYCYEAPALAGIYFGHRIDPQAREILSLILAGQNPGVRLWQAIMNPGQFGLHFEEFTYTSHTDAKREGLA